MLSYGNSWSATTERKPLGSPPPARQRGGEGLGVGAAAAIRISSPPTRLGAFAPHHPPHRSSKSDVSDLDQSMNGRTREHPGSVGGGYLLSLFVTQSSSRAAANAPAI